MSLSGIFKFFVGFIVGIILLAAGGVAVGYYFWTKLSAIPAKPIFAEERPKATPVSKKSSSTASKSASSQRATPSESPEKPLPPGAYRARVSWQEGLILRDSPGPDANRIGGVTYNQEVIVLKESDDQKWQQIRLAKGDQEGWIKAGNIEKIDQ